jgi:tripartite-type tricarboxylate transporter receptor subunit TctC
MLQRRRFNLFAVACLASGAAHAQDSAWPTRPVHVVVPFPAGGGPDMVGRLLTDKWSALGQSAYVDNKPGAGGNIGADVVAKSPHDGHTLVIATVGTFAINVSLYDKLPFDPIKDFTPITFIASTPNLLVVRKDLPVSNVRELIELAKKQRLTYASAGSGTSIHLSAELFDSMASVKMTHVPYKGRAQFIPDLLAGRVDLVFDNMSSALPLVKSGELKAIAVTGSRRSPAAPDIPTIAESGLPNYEATAWVALLAPAGLPREIQTKINLEARRALAMPDVTEKMTELGLDPKPGTPEELSAFMGSEIAKWAKVVKESGAKVD